jgi:hypothetical protein
MTDKSLFIAEFSQKTPEFVDYRTFIPHFAGNT